MNKVYVWMSKEEIDSERLTGHTAVVMDVLLATTTMVTMVENGARRVFPAANMEEAESLSELYASPLLIRGGEDDGSPIASFDRGPFPAEYNRESIAGKDVVFLTTNGTRAVRKAQTAKRVLLACLRNALAVADYVLSSDTDVFLICAGSTGHVSLEDTLCAALIASRFDANKWKFNDAAVLLRELIAGKEGMVRPFVNHGRVGRWFNRTGEQAVLDFVAEVGASSTLVDVKDGQLRALEYKAL
ncbi:2-phosphosulfolactate phosphatase [Alicyclobacillus tolerans]|uniref:2-phosphosulfolactate phosphatase n=1 Tax=Alicyclobacillus tolerans TaxID=90970 RepID=UPI001F3DFB29|nr:2-phosphosulfolactate phosphatase [Alicyclobacillus tolerans]MCF8565346.1 2-phosphosulfolactate phosphatase [Alicyclobacillus tolerans]